MQFNLLGVHNSSEFVKAVAPDERIRTVEHVYG